MTCDNQVTGLFRNITAPAARLDVTEAGSRHTVEAVQTTTSTVAFAAYAGILGSSDNRYFDGRVSGDSSGRFVMQMTADQLIAEFKDTVLDLHFAKRHIAALETENASLRAQLEPESGESAGSPMS
ncbi:hypothetical protein [Streptomyces swartbergensis]|uniref:hypothetical protein n=1 Tax=Streptomyces swartbergensis TaxID=487165 RepID=UPI003806F458